ncbi:MAG: S41 family peptidase [Candidatus Geothermincolales bacterium]
MEENRPQGQGGQNRKNLVNLLLVLFALVLLASCLSLSLYWELRPSSRKSARSQEPLHAEIISFLEGKEAVREAAELIGHSYVEPVEKGELMEAAAMGVRRMYREGRDEQTLVARALKAMVDGLDDPYSTYMTQEETEMLQTQLSGRFSGVGLALEMVKNEVRVTGVLPGTPAEESGIHEGDVIREVDGRDISGMTLEQVVMSIRGPQGTQVTLGILRRPERELIRVSLTRRDIEIPVLQQRLLEDSVGYIKLSDWTEDADRKVEEALKELRSKGARYLLMDLRSNRGGYMEPAIRVADMFLSEGTIVSSWGRTQGASQMYRADERVEWDLPVVVLVNRWTASASEIFAAALKENGRCLLVGENTYGKGAIQKLFPLEDGSAIRLTLARYRTPSGNDIDEQGIKPDVQVRNPVAGDRDLQLERALEVLRGGWDQKGQVFPISAGFKCGFVHARPWALGG